MSGQGASRRSRFFGTGSRCLTVALVGAALVGCIASSGDRHHPLFAEGPDTPPPGQRSRLSGYVRYVDGRDVSSLGTSFELWPGCHVVGTPSSWGKGDRNGALSASTGRIDFAIRMRPGYRYFIDVRVEDFSGPTGTIHVLGIETNSQGKRTQTFGPTRDQAELAACLSHSTTQ